MIKVLDKRTFVWSLLATLVMIGVNVLAMFPIINGQKTDEVSAAYPNLFTPAGITFSIWGVIYLFVIVWQLFQLFGRQKLAKKDQAALVNINKIYVVTCILNAGWLVAWQFEVFWLSVIIMAGLLVGLVMIMQEIKRSTIGRGLGFWLKSTFGFYLGWIMVATIANITVLLVSAGWEAFGGAASWWTVGIVAIGALIGSLAVVSYRNVYLAMALVWAYVGILIQHLGGDLPGSPYGNILTTVCVSLVVIGVSGIVVGMRNARAIRA